jgi:hyperosmotically inducible protein
MLIRLPIAVLAAGLIFSVPAQERDQRKLEPPSARQGAESRDQARIAREARHELVMLPDYGVFDHLAFRVDGSHVTLLGSVTRPTLKSAAENVVSTIEGVEQVTNNIEVLPPSPADDRIRLAVYRAIYSQPGLDRYALAAVPPIHIIVKNGNVTLEGVVNNEADKNLANIQARGVPGIFDVKNNLQVESRQESTSGGRSKSAKK